MNVLFQAASRTKARVLRDFGRVTNGAERRTEALRSLLTGVPVPLALRILALHFVKSCLRLPITFSHSQTGEDLILSVYLPERDGFYVDIGANDPLRYSNTFFLYKRGWRGLAIEANELLVDRYRNTRKRDICLNVAVSSHEGSVTLHRSQDTLVSTIDTSALDAWKTKWEFRPEDQVEIRTATLTKLLDENLPKDIAAVDLLSIDVEGHEFDVLSGLDFDRYKPRVIVIEVHDLQSIQSNRSHLYLIDNGYTLVGYATMNAYYFSRERLAGAACGSVASTRSYLE